MLPVMIGALVSMLQGFPVLNYLYWGFPIATIVAFCWTWVRVREEIVELHLQGNTAAAVSLLSAAARRKQPAWYRILDVNSDSDRLRITLGHDEIRLVRRSWPDFEEIATQLHAPAFRVDP